MFKTQNFCHIASNNRNQVKVGVFVYRTTDDLATVLTSGYFNDRIIDINLHDLIIHEKVDNADATKVQRNLLCVTERTLENVGTSVIKSKWEGDIEQAIADLQTYVDNNFVKIDGTSVMSAPLKFLAGSMRGAVGPYLNGVSFWKMDSQGVITNIANLTDNQFLPVATNSIDIGRTANIWKDIYVARVITSVINNGFDIAVPVTNSADTLALKSQVDDAANSGEQLYSTGVWYAKMYAATVVPTGAEYDGRNYADFSQVDSDNNPVIKIYTGASGAWTLTETITPPATHNGYITVTSKIWDIAEQSGQQGGQVLWSWNSKTFTPYPRIVSFDGIHVAGDSTVVMPLTPTDDSIVNKKYVDDATAGNSYHPDLFDWKWADHELNDIQWLRADTFSWQDGSVYEEAYQHLVNDKNSVGQTFDVIEANINGTWYIRDQEKDVSGQTYQYAYTSFLGDTVQTVYASSVVGLYTTSMNFYDGPTSSATLVASVSGSDNFDTEGIEYLPERETIAGIDILFYRASDGHKIVLANQENAVAAIFTATGVAWYYILDTVNQRFKLPRTKFGVTGLRDTVGNYVEAGLPNITGSFQEMQVRSPNPSATGAFSRVSNGTTDNSGSGSSGNVINVYTTSFNASSSDSIYGNSTTVQPKATQMYLYFYVGSFTQTALENTAGLNAELFNGKVDVGHEVIAFQAPTAANNYTWYRKYADGWVEQGGNVALNTTSVNLPVSMSNTEYQVQISPRESTNTGNTTIAFLSTTTQSTSSFGVATSGIKRVWEVKGMAA